MRQLSLSRIYGMRALVSVCCIVAVLFMDASNNVAMSEEATKQETIEYIEKKLKLYYGHSCETRSPIGALISLFKEFSISDDGTIKTKVEHFSHLGNRSDTITKHQVAHVSDLDWNAVRVEHSNIPACPNGARILVILYCLAGECVADRTRWSSSDPVKEYRYKQMDFEFKPEHTAEAERVAKAFRHLIKLYGGQGSKELFD